MKVKALDVKTEMETASETQEKELHKKLSHTKIAQLLDLVGGLHMHSDNSSHFYFFYFFLYILLSLSGNLDRLSWVMLGSFFRVSVIH